MIVALTGTILYKTYEYWLWWHAIIFVGGFVLTITGLYFLVAFRQDDEIEAEFQRRKSSAAMDGGDSRQTRGESAMRAASDDQGVELLAQMKAHNSSSISSSNDVSRDTSMTNPVMSELGIDTPASSDQNDGQETRGASPGATMHTVDLADD